MSFTVTVGQTGSVDVGMAILLKVFTGQAASPIGNNTTGATNGTPSLSITPNATGSLIVGANLGASGTYTANGATTYEQQVSGAGLEYVHMRSTSTTTASTPVTIGGTASASSISIALLEILKGTGLAEDASSPAGSGFSAVTSMTTAAFAPPVGSLLVLMVTANGNAGVNGIHVTDTSGLGLTWTEQPSKQNGAGNGYSGVWTAQVPSGASHTATAALTVTPSFSAARSHGQHRSASLTVVPAFSAARARGRVRAASLTVVPSFSAAKVHGQHRTASLTVHPGFSAARRAGHSRTGSLLVVPSFAAVAAVAAPVVKKGSWWGLSSVFKESQQEFDAYWSTPPTACPVCGQPLEPGPSTPRGATVQLFCNYAGDHSFVFPRDWHPPTRPVPNTSAGGLS